MPKTNLCKPQKDHREAEVKALIIGGLARRGMNRDALAKKMKRPTSTVNQHIRDIREMRLGELWDILDILQPDEIEKARIL